MHQPDLSISRVSLEFTKKEINLFQRRYEEGYDIPGDSRYEAWLEMCHPDVSVSRKLFPQSMQSPHKMNAEETDAEAHEMDGNQLVEIPVQKAKLGHILKVPAPPGAQKSHETRGARVLTSSDYLAEVEDKERLKQVKVEQVELRKRQREEKARLKVAEKAAKAAAKVAKAAAKAAAKGNAECKQKKIQQPKQKELPLCFHFRPLSPVSQSASFSLTVPLQRNRK